MLFPRPCDSLFARRYYILTLTPSAPCLSFFLSSLVCLDIGSWLQLFGFQLHNVVPGFPKPDVGRLEQTYELMKTQTKTQNWDSSKVSPSTVLYDAVFLVVVVFFLYHYRYPELTNNLAGRRRAQGFFFFFFLATNTFKNLVMCTTHWGNNPGTFRSVFVCTVCASKSWWEPTRRAEPQNRT